MKSVIVEKTDDIQLHRDKSGLWSLVRIVGNNKEVLRSEHDGTTEYQLRLAMAKFRVFKTS